MRILILFIILPFGLLGQDLVKTDTSTICDSTFFNYFTGETNTEVPIMNALFVISLDSIKIKGELFCKVISKNEEEIFIHDRKLMSFISDENGEVRLGQYYYLKSGSIAILAEFKKNKLHGSVYSFSKNGELLNVMRYKRGEFVKYNYIKGILKKSVLRRFSKRIDGDPIKMNQTIYR